MTTLFRALILATTALLTITAAHAQRVEWNQVGSGSAGSRSQDQDYYDQQQRQQPSYDQQTTHRQNADGRSSTRIGNSEFNSNGSTSTHIGGSSFNSSGGGRDCQTIGVSTFCK